MGGARIERYAVVLKRQAHRIVAGLQRNAHLQLVSVRRAVFHNVGDDLLEHQLDVVACRAVQSCGIERFTQTRKRPRETFVGAGETDLDAPRVHGAIRLQGRRAQLRTAAAAAVESERTGTI